jgi:hypothetical protein
MPTPKSRTPVTEEELRNIILFELRQRTGCESVAAISIKHLARSECDWLAVVEDYGGANPAMVNAALIVITATLLGRIVLRC